MWDPEECLVLLVSCWDSCSSSQIWYPHRSQKELFSLFIPPPCLKSFSGFLALWG